MNSQEIEILEPTISVSRQSAPLQSIPVQPLAIISRFAKTLTPIDYIIYGGTAFVGIFIAFQAAKPGTISLSRGESPRFNANAAISGVNQSTDSWMDNFQLFLEDTQKVARIDSARHYQSAAREFKNDPANPAFGENSTVLLASFLDNRATEVRRITETPGSKVVMELSKAEAIALIGLRTEAVLAAHYTPTLPNTETQPNLLQLQIAQAANLLRTQDAANAETISRQQLQEELR